MSHVRDTMVPSRPTDPSSSPLRSSFGLPRGRAADQASDPPDLPPSRPATSHKQLNDYRERLARDLEARELSTRGLHTNSSNKTRVSPIPEEGLSGAPIHPGSLTSTSAESNNTIRAAIAPEPLAWTPSYPFPRMINAGSGHMHPSKSIASRPPPVGFRMPQTAAFEPQGVLDSVLSENSTPASNYTFNPSAATSYHEGNFDFPSPNLYDLSLMLSAEPGLDAWWSTVVHITRDVYKAERVTLAVPADSTDLENVLWGQKATYSEHDHDKLSMTYMARGSSAMRSSDRGTSDVALTADNVSELGTPTRPGLPSRHSFTSYEDEQRSLDKSPSAPRRPENLMRSKSHFQSARLSGEACHGQTELNKNVLEHDAAEAQAIPSWEAPFVARFEGQGRVLPVLQALNYEEDPLIDHAGVMRVLQRGRPVALTRSYPYLPACADQPTDQPTYQKLVSKPPSSDPVKRPKRPRAESTSKLSLIFPGPTRTKSNASDKAKSIVSRLEEDEPRPLTPKYEEYEQAPPSPWSQSPAPSPAIRNEPNENPFFTDAMVDEGSFNPDSAPSSYSGMPPPEAIGVDNSWTVLHIPLAHVLLSRPLRPFKLDASAMEQRSHARQKDEKRTSRKGSLEPDRQSPELAGKNDSAPIAILSILGPIIPYPTNLRRSLEHLAPHMATSFSLCRHYSNLETELAGLQRRRPLTAGFGALATFPRHVDNRSFLAPAEIAQQQSLAGSMTSPSDYSAVSKSATASPMGTPSWEQGPLSYLVDKRPPAASPAVTPQGGEGYFSSKQRPGSARPDVLGSGTQRSKSGPKEVSQADKKSFLLSACKTGQDVQGPEPAAEKPMRDVDEAREQWRKETALRNAREAGADAFDEAAASKSAERQCDTVKIDASRSHHGHSVLYSYGADLLRRLNLFPELQSSQQTDADVVAATKHIPDSLECRHATTV